MNFYDSFMNSYCILQNINCHGVYPLKFSFMNFMSLIMNYFDLVMNDYGHYYVVGWVQTIN